MRLKTTTTIYVPEKYKEIELPERAKSRLTKWKMRHPRKQSFFIVQANVKKQTNKQINSKTRILTSSSLFYYLNLKNILDLFTNYFLGQKFNKMDVMSCLVSMKALKTTGTDSKYFPFPRKKQCWSPTEHHWPLVGRGSGHKRYQIRGIGVLWTKKVQIS